MIIMNVLIMFETQCSGNLNRSQEGCKTKGFLKTSEFEERMKDRYSHKDSSKAF